MAKINIPFDNTNYSVDEASLASAAAELKSHLSTVMNGSGATIKLDGVSYGIDSTKLSAATNAFVTHLGTISGSGKKVVVNGTTYNIGSDKVAGAVADMHAVLGGLHSPDNGSDDGLPITWDGNTSGLLAVKADENNVFYKVSNMTFTNEQIKNMSYSAVSTSNGEISTYPNIGECWDGMVSEGYVTDDIVNFYNELVIVRKAGAIDMFGTTYPEVGIYFVLSTSFDSSMYYPISLHMTNEKEN